MRGISRITSIFLLAFYICIPIILAPAQNKQIPKSNFPSATLPAGLAADTADLIITGKIKQAEPLLLDMKTIKSLPAITFSSVDPWDGKVHQFTGVLLEGILDWIGIEDSAYSLVLTARNQYSVPIRREDYERYGYIIAYAMDGKEFSADPDDKKRGPLAIAIDFTKNKDLAQEVYKHQLLWQLHEIQIQ